MPASFLGIQPRVLLFGIMNCLLLGGAVLGLYRQRRFMENVSGYFRSITGEDLKQDLKPASLLSRNYVVIGICLSVVLTIYPFFFEYLPLRSPYLVRKLPTFGTELQVIIGVVLWMPTILIVGAGLAEAYRFNVVLKSELNSIDPAVDLEENVQVLRGLFDVSLEKLFRSLQVLLFLWGIVGGLAISIIFFARENMVIIVGSSIAVSVFIGYLFVSPILWLSRWVAERSAAVQTDLRSELIESRLHTISETITSDGETYETDHGFPSAELHDIIESLPPANPFVLLWNQILQTLVALLGPFISLLAKVLLAII